jgi:hypothetical protein
MRGAWSLAHPTTYHSRGSGVLVLAQEAQWLSFLSPWPAQPILVLHLQGDAVEPFEL